MFIVGIDPGVTTGLASWCTDEKRLVEVTSMQAAEAMLQVQLMHTHGVLGRVVFEDARLRCWFGTRGAEALQGAGSIKRDCSMWSEWLALLGIKHQGISPKAKGPKLPADRFAKLTGWPCRTNEHSRDAAMLVWRSA